ncbi:uncharacterized protein LOC132759384 [Ruditapes philippinarum]|uniref:uncharacterized protein LOC132759384 n=1 Tax=Ruditapes philippinarum TaxID=129788 RepID=UPI00295B7347|nr:uncharacterized protein LOC132759384 [Ruditapes philippinarum]
MEVNTKYIHDAFVEIGYNSTAADFNDFLGTLPKCTAYVKGGFGIVKSISQGSAIVEREQRNIEVFALQNKTETFEIAANKSLHIRRRESNEVAYHLQKNNTPRFRSNFPAIPGSSASSRSSQNASLKRKRYGPSMSSDSDTDFFPHKRTRNERSTRYQLSTTSDSDINSFPSIKRQKSKMRMRKLQASKKKDHRSRIRWDKIDKETLIIDMTKRLLELDQDLDNLQYDIFVKHTLTLIINKSKVSETVILSIKVSDYENIQEIKGRYKHVTYILDTEDTRLHLGIAEWGCLKLYAEKAREQVVHRLKLENDKFLQSTKLFIEYNGKSFGNEEKDETLQASFDKQVKNTESRGQTVGDDCPRMSSTHKENVVNNIESRGEAARYDCAPLSETQEEDVENNIGSPGQVTCADCTTLSSTHMESVVQNTDSRDKQIGDYCATLTSTHTENFVNSADSSGLTTVDN